MSTQLHGQEGFHCLRNSPRHSHIQHWVHLIMRWTARGSLVELLAAWQSKCGSIVGAKTIIEKLPLNAVTSSHTYVLTNRQTDIPTDRATDMHNIGRQKLNQWYYWTTSCNCGYKHIKIIQCTFVLSLREIADPSIML